MAVNIGSLGKRVKSYFDDTVSPMLKGEKDRLLDETSTIRAKAKGTFDDAANKARARLDEELIPKTKGTAQAYAQSRTGRALGGLGRATGNSLNNLSSSKVGMGILGAGMLAAGGMSTTGPAVKDAALEAAFGDPNADRYFTGRDLDARFFAGSLMGGVGGGLLQATAPGDYLAANPLMGSEGAFMGSLFATRTAGGIVGSMPGAAFGSFLGSSMGPRGAKIGKVAGGLIGGFVGGLVGATIPIAGGIGGHMATNRDFYQNSPYSSSRGTSQALSATGDIVLGMHNSRRGY